MGYSFEELVARGPTVKTDRNSDTWCKSYDILIFTTWNKMHVVKWYVHVGIFSLIGVTALMHYWASGCSLDAAFF